MTIHYVQDDGDEAAGRDAQETEVYGQFRGPFLVEIWEPASLFGDPLLCLREECHEPRLVEGIEKPEAAFIRRECHGRQTV